MIKFLLKGLLRDKSRSLLPVIAVTAGVMLTVWLHAYINGFMGDIIDTNARFSDGHLKVMSKVYSENMDEFPNDLALLGADSITNSLGKEFPDISWAQRIRFGGLIDAPDQNGETKAQGPVFGIGLDLLSPGSQEINRLNLAKSLREGALPKKHFEILLSEDFAKKLTVKPGDRVTLISSTMNGSVAIYNFSVAGTVSFGSDALDKGTVIADMGDVRTALDMNDASGEILGFFNGGYYDEDLALQTASSYNSTHKQTGDEFAPVMKTLSQQGSMNEYIKLSSTYSAYVAIIFILAMSLVLWNAGLIGGLRRYGEIGLRLAMGEEKGHVYRSMLMESVMIGLVGSITGTIIGLFFAWLLQRYGIDLSGMMKGTSIMIPSVVRAHITAPDYYLGFIPGLISTVTGTALSGIGIYKRQTARLFKELEA
jgi:putative ABC transport system permease protein